MGDVAFETISFLASEPTSLINGNLASEVDPGIFAPSPNESSEVFDPKTEQTVLIARGDTVLEVFDVEWTPGDKPPTPQAIVNALASDADILPVSARYLTIDPDSTGQVEIVFVLRKPDVEEVVIFSISGIVIAGVISAIAPLFLFLSIREVRKTAQEVGPIVTTSLSIGFFIVVVIVGAIVATKLGVRF